MGSLATICLEDPVLRWTKEYFELPADKQVLVRQRLEIFLARTAPSADGRKRRRVTRIAPKTRADVLPDPKSRTTARGVDPKSVRPDLGFVDDFHEEPLMLVSGVLGFLRPLRCLKARYQSFVERLHLVALYRISTTSNAALQTRASENHVEKRRLRRQLKRGAGWDKIGVEYILLLPPTISNSRCVRSRAYFRPRRHSLTR